MWSDATFQREKSNQMWRKKSSTSAASDKTEQIYELNAVFSQTVLKLLLLLVGGFHGTILLMSY